MLLQLIFFLFGILFLPAIVLLVGLVLLGILRAGKAERGITLCPNCRQHVSPGSSICSNCEADVVPPPLENEYQS